MCLSIGMYVYSISLSLSLPLSLSFAHTCRTGQQKEIRHSNNTTHTKDMRTHTFSLPLFLSLSHTHTYRKSQQKQSRNSTISTAADLTIIYLSLSPPVLVVYLLLEVCRRMQTDSSLYGVAHTCVVSHLYDGADSFTCVM